MAPRTPGVLTREAIQKWIGALLLASLLIGGIVGVLGAEHTFDWSLAAVASTAFGTVVLAGFTGALAWTTSGDVRATWELAELTRKDQEERVRPRVLVYKRGGVSGGGQQGRLPVFVANAGLGPALKVEVRAIYDGPGNVGNGAIHIPYMRPGATSDDREIEFNIGDSPPGGVRAENFRLEGGYRDMAQQVIHPVVDLTP